MKYDELAFVNQQLASMLREGIPLEGSLRQLCATMRKGPLRAELQLLETDLAAGTPLDQAVARRKLPEFYGMLLQMGARSRDLPGLLTLLADYYQNANLVWTRLKGLMVYPAIVLTLSAGFSFWIAVLFGRISSMLAADRGFTGWVIMGTNTPLPPVSVGAPCLWAPVALLAAVAVPALLVAVLPRLRREMQWRLPAFREASLSRLASTMAILLKAGCSLSQALALLEKMESGTRAAAELGRWQARCAEGRAKFTDLAAGGKIFPPMFVWLVAGAGENLAAGFERAARVYHDRAAYRSNVLLYAALPASLLFLGLVILAQMYPVAQFIFQMPRLFSQ
ncbi:MAG: type II secretion system F family protein [Verrucomicrobiota bacterium]|jgi:type II secretory pathway component PulF